SPRRRTRIQITASGTGEPTFVPEPVLIGDYPIAVGLCAVRAHTDHVATYRLGPIFHEVRQRLFASRPGGNGTAPGNVTAPATRPLPTQALAIFPNPESLPDAAPKLTL